MKKGCIQGGSAGIGQQGGQECASCNELGLLPDERCVACGRVARNADDMVVPARANVAPNMPTVSVGPFKNEDGTYRVEVIVNGLSNEQLALSCADMLTAILCGKEIQLS
jgi:hypothetical protein